MKKLWIGWIVLCLIGCESDQFHRGYVISQSHLDEEEEGDNNVEEGPIDFLGS